MSINNDAKSIKDQEMGTVSILISSNTFLLDSELEKDFVKIPENSDQPPFKVLIKGNGSIKEIPLQERQKKINDYGKEFFVDEYQIKVPIGFYVIEVEGITIYQFPKFLVDKNEVVRFEVSERKFLETLCSENYRYIDLEYNGERLKNFKDNKGNPTYKLLKTDVFSLIEPFQSVVSYFEKETIGQVIKYKNAELRYKNFTIFANQLIVNKDLLTITALGIREISSLFKQNQNKLGAINELTIDLRKNRN